jgi:hypothetical protein
MKEAADGEGGPHVPAPRSAASGLIHAPSGLNTEQALDQLLIGSASLD